MQWIVLLVIGIFYGISTYLTYNETNRKAWWFIPATLSIGIVVNLIWCSMVRYLDDKQRIYVFSLFWDAIMVFVWYFIPVMFFNVKIDRWILFGILLMVIGLSIVKFRIPSLT